MTEPTITCPNCKTEIKLTESLAAPLIAATRQQFEQQLAQKDRDIAAREQAMRDKEKQLADAKNKLDEDVANQVETQLKKDRTRIAAEDEQRLKVMEKEQTIAAMQKQIEDLKRRAEQGSQQLQGEVQELELENLLRGKFPFDAKRLKASRPRPDMVYQYLTGPRFRQRVEAIVEAFSTMQEDLDKERKVIMKQWAKREEQIMRVMGATVGMYGDLQGIAGKSLQEIEGLELPSLGFNDEA